MWFTSKFFLARRYSNIYGTSNSKILWNYQGKKLVILIYYHHFLLYIPPFKQQQIKRFAGVVSSFVEAFSHFIFVFSSDSNEVIMNWKLSSLFLMKILLTKMGAYHQQIETLRKEFFLCVLKNFFQMIVIWKLFSVR